MSASKRLSVPSSGYDGHHWLNVRGSHRKNFVATLDDSIKLVSSKRLELEGQLIIQEIHFPAPFAVIQTPVRALTIHLINAYAKSVISSKSSWTND